MNKRYRCNTAVFFVLNWKSSPHNFDHFSPKPFLLFGCGCFIELFKLQQCTNSSVTLFICPLYIFFFFLVPPCHYLILEVRRRQGFAMRCSFYIFWKRWEFARAVNTCLRYNGQGKPLQFLLFLAQPCNASNASKPNECECPVLMALFYK